MKHGENSTEDSIKFVLYFHFTSTTSMLPGMAVWNSQTIHNLPPSPPLPALSNILLRYSDIKAIKVAVCRIRWDVVLYSISVYLSLIC